MGLSRRRNEKAAKRKLSHDIFFLLAIFRSTYNYFQNILHYIGIFYHVMNTCPKINHEINCYLKLLKIHPSSDGVDLSYIKQNNINIKKGE